VLASQEAVASALILVRFKIALAQCWALCEPDRAYNKTLCDSVAVRVIFVISLGCPCIFLSTSSIQDPSKQVPWFTQGPLKYQHLYDEVPFVEIHFPHSHPGPMLLIHDLITSTSGATGIPPAKANGHPHWYHGTVEPFRTGESSSHIIEPQSFAFSHYFYIFLSPQPN
jgi:hypothetical protein